LNNILQFIYYAIKLKNLKRKGWVKKLNVKDGDAESVADHSYLTALITMLIGDLKGIDTSKAIRIALLHDLAESIVGDYTPEEIDNIDKHNVENDAMEKILSLLPKDISNYYKELWIEYNNKDSIEARLVYEIDKLELIIQAEEYRKKGYPTNKLTEFYNNKEYITDSYLLSMLNDLKQG